MIEIILTSMPEISALLELLLVMGALLVTISDSVKQAITWYQIQCVLLVIVTTATAAPKSGTAVGLILGIAFLPFLLAITIRPFLHFATLPIPGASGMEVMRTLFAAIVGPWLEKLFSLRQGTRPPPLESPSTPATLPKPIAERLTRYRNLERDAEIEWQSRQSMQKNLIPLLLFPMFLLFAVMVASNIEAEFGLTERVGLAVSLALHLIGLYNMVVKRDLISQVIGLLIMDQGLYLAVVKIVEIPVPATFFVISLYFYTLITVFVLAVLLPKVRENTGNIDLADIARTSDLTSK